MPAQSGEMRSTAAAVLTCAPPRAWKSSEKITAIPAKPIRIPRVPRTVNRSPARAKWAATATISGMVAKSTAARPGGDGLLGPVEDAVGDGEGQQRVGDPDTPLVRAPAQLHAEERRQRQQRRRGESEAEGHAGERRNAPQPDPDHRPGGAPDQDQPGESGPGESAGRFHGDARRSHEAALRIDLVQHPGVRDRLAQVRAGPSSRPRSARCPMPKPLCGNEPYLRTSRYHWKASTGRLCCWMRCISRSWSWMRWLPPMISP